MAKEKNSSDQSAPRKTAAKKAPAKKAVPGKAFAAAVSAPAPSSGPAHRNHPSMAELYEEIRCRAYDFYCERGGHHGSHEADWHRAELEVRSKYK
jgi:Protein of unknown function (DUF2934)